MSPGKPKLVFLVLLVCLLVGCDGKKPIIQTLIPKDEDACARRFIEAVRAGDYPTVKQIGDFSKSNSDETARGLRDFHELLAREIPISVETVGFNAIYNQSGAGDGHKTTLLYQIKFPSGWLACDVCLDRKPNSLRVVGTHFNPLPNSLEAINRFSLKGKTPGQYAFLAACIAIPIYILLTLIVCIRSQAPRKWAWLLFILFGIVQVHLDWTSGRMGLDPFSFLLLGASAFRPGMSSFPWILSCGFPLGATVYLHRFHDVAGVLKVALVLTAIVLIVMFLKVT